MEDLYRELILEHYKHPHNAGTLEHPDASQEEYNPLCGDRVRIDLRIEDGIIKDVRFQGRGCAISQASASLLTDEILGKSVADVQAFGKQDMLDLLGVPLDKNPVRIKCALLPLKALKLGIYTFLGATIADEEI